MLNNLAPERLLVFFGDIALVLRNRQCVFIKTIAEDTRDLGGGVSARFWLFSFLRPEHGFLPPL